MRHLSIGEIKQVIDEHISTNRIYNDITFKWSAIYDNPRYNEAKYNASLDNIYENLNTFLENRSRKCPLSLGTVHSYLLEPSVNGTFRMTSELAEKIKEDVMNDLKKYHHFTRLSMT